MIPWDYLHWEKWAEICTFMLQMGKLKDFWNFDRNYWKTVINIRVSMRIKKFCYICTLLSNFCQDIALVSVFPTYSWQKVSKDWNFFLNTYSNINEKCWQCQWPFSNLRLSRVTQFKYLASMPSIPFTCSNWSWSNGIFLQSVPLTLASPIYENFSIFKFSSV